MRKHPLPLFFGALLLALALSYPPQLALAGGPGRQPLALTIAHINDTHSALEASDAVLTIGGQAYKARLGGFARLKTALDEVRAPGGNILTLHAGDAVQGTLYFNVFRGAADFDFLNALGLDAMTLGNHEFDKGPELLGGLVANARFPIVSANVDVSAEPALAGRIPPYVIKTFQGQEVAIIGATTPATPSIVPSVGRVRFAQAAASVAPVALALRKRGVNKIVLLSHNGYEEDLRLARTVPGVDVIVGGHSHTLLGDATSDDGGGYARLGLSPVGPYPTEVRGVEGQPVLVVQAWKWGQVLGVLDVRFDAGGVLAGWSARPRLLVAEGFARGGAPVAPGSAEHAAVALAIQASGVARIVPENEAFVRKLAPYAQQLQRYRDTSVGARAAVDLIRGTATDPGPLVADAYLAKVPGAQIALVGAGGVRKDIFAGEITEGVVMGVLPFGNTLVALDLTGAELRRTLEDAVEFRVAVRPPDGGLWNDFSVLHVAGLRFAVDLNQPPGQRISGLRVRAAGGAWAALDMAATYRLVTNSFLAGGGDGLATLRDITTNNAQTAMLVDTGYLEHDAFGEHLARLGTVLAPGERRVVITPPVKGVSNTTANTSAKPPAKAPGAVPGPVSVLLRRLGLPQAA